MAAEHQARLTDVMLEQVDSIGAFLGDEHVPGTAGNRQCGTGQETGLANLCAYNYWNSQPPAGIRHPQAAIRSEVT